MTATLQDILKAYLDMGYQDIQGFWRMTLSEIMAIMQSSKRRLERERQRQENETKQQIIMLRNLSIQTGESVACLFDKNKKELLPLSVYYPGLFDNASEKQEVSLETYTTLFEDFAYRHNMRRKRGGGDNG